MQRASWGFLGKREGRKGKEGYQPTPHLLFELSFSEIILFPLWSSHKPGTPVLL